MSLFARIKLRTVDQSDSARFRTYRFKLALLSSIAGKGVSTVSQLVAFPIAIAALGIDRFGVYAMLVAMLGWINVAGVAITPGLTVQIINASSAGDRDAEAKVFNTAVMFSLCVALFIFVFLEMFFNSVGVASMFGPDVLLYQSEVEFGLQFMAIFMSLNIIMCPLEAAQAGYQNQHINNLIMTIGGVLTILAIFFEVRQQPTIPNLILSVYGIPLTVRVLNVVHVLWNRRYLLPSRKNISFVELRKMLVTGGAFLLTVLGTYLYQGFTVYWAGRELGPEAAAQMSVMILVLSISGSLLITLTQPLWPAIQDAIAREDNAWVSAAYKRIIKLVVPYVLLAGMVLAIFGQDILGFWLNTNLDVDKTSQILWGVFFIAVAWEHLNYTVLIGMSQFWFASLTLTSGAFIMFFMSLNLANVMGIQGILISMCLGVLALSAWIYPVKIRKYLSDNKN